MLRNILNFIVFGVTYTYALAITQKRQTDEGKNPQPCPENPIVFNAKNTPQYIYSPYDNDDLYPENCDCQFVILASTLQHRIQITIIESEMEEPLFTECNDYCVIHNGESSEAPELIKWCGSNAPGSIASSNNSLYLHFHSDSIIQKRGFNLSFVEYDLSSCPPGYVIGRNNKYCYKLFTLMHSEVTWISAQRKCTYEQANLLTFENLNEFEFVHGTYAASRATPWIGYHDASIEEKFESVNPNEDVWPEKFPYFVDHIERDCIYLNFQMEEKITYAIDDCRNRRTFICKKLRDGTTVPILLSSKLAIYGMQNTTTNWTKKIFIFILIVLLVIIIFLICWKYKQTKTANQVHNIDNNQKLVANIANVEAKPTTSNYAKTNENKSGDKIINLSAPALQSSSETITNLSPKNFPFSNEALISNQENQMHLTEENLKHHNNINKFQIITDETKDDRSPRISTTPNQPLPPNYQNDNLLLKIQNNKTTNKDFDEKQQPSVTRDNSVLTNDELFFNQTEIPSDRREIELEEIHKKSFKAAMIGREDTTVTTTTMVTSGQNGIRARLKRKSFDRPRVGALDSVSAISLDEFWQK